MEIMVDEEDGKCKRWWMETLMNGNDSGWERWIGIMVDGKWWWMGIIVDGNGSKNRNDGGWKQWWMKGMNGNDG